MLKIVQKWVDRYFAEEEAVILLLAILIKATMNAWPRSQSGDSALNLPQGPVV